jgi:glyoxylase-like metal-dependent hydrolase (beta-lactamase superfamily II)
MIYVEKFIVNPLRENSFLLYDETGECIIMDAGFYYGEEFDEVNGFIHQKELKPVAMINTHCHFDHLMGVGELRKEYDLKFFCHPDDVFLIERASVQAEMFGYRMESPGAPDGFLREGDPVRFGNSALEVFHVPGHSPGHVVFYSPHDKFLLAGDVLFYGSIGRTDLPGGNYETLIDNIQKKLLVLPEETRVYSGHGPETSIGFEKFNNPFLT